MCVFQWRRDGVMSTSRRVLSLAIIDWCQDQPRNVNQGNFTSNQSNKLRICLSNRYSGALLCPFVQPPFILISIDLLFGEYWEDLLTPCVMLIYSRNWISACCFAADDGSKAARILAILFSCLVAAKTKHVSLHKIAQFICKVKQERNDQ